MLKKFQNFSKKQIKQVLIKNKQRRDKNMSTNSNYTIIWGIVPDNDEYPQI